MTLSKLKEKWEGQDIGSRDIPEVDLWYIDLKDYLKEAFRGYKVSGFNTDSLFFTGFISKDGKDIYISHEVGVGPIDFDSKGSDLTSWGFFVWDKSQPKSDGEFCSINYLVTKVKELFENDAELILYVQLVDRAKVDKVLVNGEKYRPGTEIPCKAGDKISLVHNYDQTRAWDYIDKSGNLKELGVGDVCSFIVPKAVDADDRYAELLIYQNTWIEDIIQGGSDYLDLKKSTGWVKNIVPRVKLAESKCRINESSSEDLFEFIDSLKKADLIKGLNVHKGEDLYPEIFIKLPLSVGIDALEKYMGVVYTEQEYVKDPLYLQIEWHDDAHDLFSIGVSNDIGYEDIGILNISNMTKQLISSVFRASLAESKSIKAGLKESVQKITLEQFLGVYDCDMNGVVEVHTRTGLLFKLPLEDDDTLDISEFLSRPIYRIDKYSDCLALYLG